MSIRIKMKPATKEEVIEDLSAAVTRFNAAFDDMKLKYVEKENEIEAIKLCLVTRQHLMLEGVHGIAKSQIASDAFSRITGGEAKTYEKLLMKSLQPDEVFGPVRSKKYREEEVWEVNTDGMLPEAHFAVLDEVYRGEHILSSLFGILNERVYHNGSLKVKCPLMTAVGTTNFSTETEELKAFHDRWHVKVLCQPISKGDNRQKMLISQFLRKKDAPDKTVPFDDVKLIQRHIDKVIVAEDEVELYEELVTGFRKGFGNIYISDRRYLHAFKLAQACSLLQSGNTTGFDYTCFSASRFGIAVVGEKKSSDTFDLSYSNVIKGLEDESKEKKLVSDFTATLAELKEMLRENQVSDFEEGLQQAQMGYNILTQQSSDALPKKTRYVNQLKEMVGDFKDVIDELSKRLKKKK